VHSLSVKETLKHCSNRLKENKKTEEPYNSPRKKMKADHHCSAFFMLIHLRWPINLEFQVESNVFGLGCTHIECVRPISRDR